ncbi:hypothetical protein HHX47_DHR8000254 [Lentinula edodes]|nr:hypothetical protein HHX47_DHR8000254 [Lentinula edodes]
MFIQMGRMKKATILGTLHWDRVAYVKTEIGSISTIKMHRSVTTFLTTSQGCTDCVAKERILITEDYGYFVDETCSQIALNEPMSVTFGAEWFTNANLKCKVTKLETFAFYHGTDTQPSHFALHQENRPLEIINN